MQNTLIYIKSDFIFKSSSQTVVMWYFKQTAKTLWQASKGIVVDTRSKVRKLLDEISQSEQQIIPTNKLNQLAAMTYDMKLFEQTLQTILARVKTFQYGIQEARKTLNMLIATNYLIKHGASGFVDELRSYINVFKKYQSLKDLKTYEDQGLQKQLSYELQKIKSRARHIQVLLSDKQKLLKEKQLAMLIKQKMKLYQKSKISDSNQNINNDNRKQRLERQKNRMMAQKNGKSSKNQNLNPNSAFNNPNIGEYADKIDGFLEKYLWKYVDKLDGKIQVISDKVMENFDKYVLGQLPDNFEPESMQNQDQNGQSGSGKKMSRQVPYAEYKCLEEDDDFMKKLQQQGEKAQDCNLIDFQQVLQENQATKNAPAKQQSLI